MHYKMQSPTCIFAHDKHTPLKKLFLLSVACCALGFAVQAQSSVDLTRGQSTVEEDDTAVSMIGTGGLPTQKGSSLIGADILLAQLDAAELDEQTSMHYRLGLTAHYAYFLANNFALGGEINTGIDGYTRIKQYTINAGGGIFARVYIGKAVAKNGELNKFRFFVEGGVGYGYMFDRAPNLIGDDASLDYGTLQLHLMPGINYFVNRNVAFELGLMYSYDHTVLNDEMFPDDHHTLRLSVGMQVFFCKRR